MLFYTHKQVMRIKYLVMYFWTSTLGIQKLPSLKRDDIQERVGRS